MSRSTRRRSTSSRPEGGFNFDSLGRTAGNQAPAADQDTPAGALPFLVSSLRISNGRLQFSDRSASPASELNVDRIDFSASDVGLDHPIQLDLAAALLGVAEQNVRVEGTLGPLDNPEAAASAPARSPCRSRPARHRSPEEAGTDRRGDPRRTLVAGSDCAQRKAIG